MPVPHTLKIASEREVKAASELRRYENQMDNDERRLEAGVEIGNIITNLALLMDKVMNLVFGKYGSKEGNKPNIYFPVSASKEKFEERLRQYKLSILPVQQQALFELLISPQPFEIGLKGWWPTIHRLASERHQKFPEVLPKQEAGIGFGKGQNVRINNLRIDGNGVLTIGSAQAWNQKTGRRENLRIEYIEAVQASLKDHNLSPFDFLENASEEVYRLIEKIGPHL